MGRAILAIAQEAAEREATAAPPAALFGSNARVARLLRAAANDTMREMMDRAGRDGWDELNAQWVLSLEAGVFRYPLPPDYLSLIPDTEQRGNSPLGLIGPVSPQVWSAWLAGVTIPAAPYGIRVRNGALEIQPTPQEAILVTMEYVSRYQVIASVADWTADQVRAADEADPPTPPRTGALDATAAGAGYATDAAMFADLLIPAAGTGTTREIRKERFTADTDVCAFADDHCLSLGMTYRLRRGMAMPYAEAMAEYERAVAIKAARNAGGARDFNLGRGGDGYPVAPLADGRWVVS